MRGRRVRVLVLCVCPHPPTIHLHFPHLYRVFFPCREYKDAAVGFIVGPTPALVDAHVGPYQDWDVNNSDVVVL